MFDRAAKRDGGPIERTTSELTNYRTVSFANDQVPIEVRNIILKSIVTNARVVDVIMESYVFEWRQESAFDPLVLIRLKRKISIKQP